MKMCTCCRNVAHASLFYSGRSECKPCTRAKRAAHYLKNKDAVLAAVKAYDEKNRGAKLARDKARYEAKRVELLEQKKRYHAANKVVLNAKNKAYREANRPALISYTRKWREKNAESVAAKREQTRERSNAQTREYRRANPHLVTEMEQRRRATKLRALVTWDSELDDLVFKEAFMLAKTRERVVGGKWHVDHTEPLRAADVCGLHNAYNLQVVPAAYNLRKGNRRTEQREWVLAL